MIKINNLIIANYIKKYKQTKNNVGSYSAMHRTRDGGIKHGQTRQSHSYPNTNRFKHSLSKN